MTTKEAKKLKVAERVKFSDGVLGTIMETGYNAVKIAWDDGQVGVIHLDDMQEVERAP